MSTTSPTRRPHRDEVRRRILDAALAVFAERGFERSSLDLVAERANFTKGAVYSNFTNKDTLFLELMERQVALRLETIRSSLGSLQDQTTEQIGRQLARSALADRQWQLIFLEYWARAMRDPEVRKTFLAHRRSIRAAIAEAIDESLADRPEVDRAALANLVVILSNGYAIEAMIDPDQVSEDIIAGALDSAL